MTAPTYAGSGTPDHDVATLALTPSLMSATAGSLFLLHLSHQNSALQFPAPYFITGGNFSAMFSASVSFFRSFLYLTVASGTESTLDTISIQASGGTTNIRHAAVVHKFINCSSVWESSAANAIASTNVINDAAVTTLGSSRLAVNCVAVSNFVGSSEFTGETGGNWNLNYFSTGSTNTACQLTLLSADMPSSGTIDGGAYTMPTSFTSIVQGFALIAAPPAATGPVNIFEPFMWNSPVFGAPY